SGRRLTAGAAGGPQQRNDECSAGQPREAAARERVTRTAHACCVSSETRPLGRRDRVAAAADRHPASCSLFASPPTTTIKRSASTGRRQTREGGRRAGAAGGGRGDRAVAAGGGRGDRAVAAGDGPGDASGGRGDACAAGARWATVGG